MNSILRNVNFDYFPHLLKFKFEAGTSRGVLKQKTTYILKASVFSNTGTVGFGEAAPLPLLSLDDIPDFGMKMSGFCKSLSGADIPMDAAGFSNWINTNISEHFPSIRFAFETALLDLFHGGKQQIFDTDFFKVGKTIPINGLIWMGDKGFMKDQIEKKLDEGYDCIKIKIGAIDFEQECELLYDIRSRFSKDKITLRVDANGAFSPDQALAKLQILSKFDLQSIEQPIRQGQMGQMAELCKVSPLAIALDEELIGVYGESERRGLLESIMPHYIVLKPTLVGGIQATREWIDFANELGIGWWMTSALESNIGLNAIAQLTSTFENILPQGLGTGQLYENNFDSPLVIEKGKIRYDKNLGWGISQ
ncbi:o-succinylbenzoate synthase [Rhodonellum sp.]|uniref:o-succinylbenzoate synthase n=1 Tax=Rhodonellum sp. TaxID=2231180 RepID=UPI0027203955|nr:o-succinylbenzoate synthase [Rhodonellum sp.]MDO9552805.1 o-succinylbenzoate synthase [Rhodonellum sp.]